MSKFVMIIGPQAVGKMTVAQELSEITGYKLFYNHMTIEPLKLIFDYDREIYGKINSKIRNIIFNEFAKSKEDGIIFTACLDFGKGLKKQLKEFYKWTKSYDEIYVVELEASLENRLKRNKTENRLFHKPSKRDIKWSEKELLNSTKIYTFNSYGNQAKEIFKNYLKINNNFINARKTAQIICEYFSLKDNKAK